MATLRKIKTAERTTTPKAEQAFALGTENYRELNITGLRGIEWVIFGADRPTKPRFT